jgi:hypothetical protein
LLGDHHERGLGVELTKEGHLVLALRAEIPLELDVNAEYREIEVGQITTRP